jgi:hypothetical protein
VQTHVPSGEQSPRPSALPQVGSDRPPHFVQPKFARTDGKKETEKRKKRSDAYEAKKEKRRRNFIHFINTCVLRPPTVRCTCATCIDTVLRHARVWVLQVEDPRATLIVGRAEVVAATAVAAGEVVEMMIAVAYQTRAEEGALGVVSVWLAER